MFPFKEKNWRKKLKHVAWLLSHGGRLGKIHCIYLLLALKSFQSSQGWRTIDFILLELKMAARDKK
jgi:hypothetical protein